MRCLKQEKEERVIIRLKILAEKTKTHLFELNMLGEIVVREKDFVRWGK